MTRKLVVAVAAVAAGLVVGCSIGKPEENRREKKIIGYMLDVSRHRVPTMETVRRQVDVLAELGYNHFELYTEHTFAYSKHETVWRGAVVR